MNATAAGERQQAPRGPLWIAIGIGLGWIAILSVMALFTSNPVTLNRNQLRESDLVIVGQVQPDGQVARFDDSPDWPFPPDTKLQVVNLQATSAKVGQAYLLPLTRAGHTTGRGQDLVFAVTASRLPNAAPLIYPATKESLQQWSELRQTAPAHSR
jgi:hypothetical protein